MNSLFDSIIDCDSNFQYNEILASHVGQNILINQMDHTGISYFLSYLMVVNGPKNFNGVRQPTAIPLYRIRYCHADYLVNERYTTGGRTTVVKRLPDFLDIIKEKLPDHFEMFLFHPEMLK
mgnify:CR=1 FL=1